MRGLSSLRLCYVHTMMASVKTRNGNCYNRFASLQTPYYFCLYLHGFKNPRLFALRASRLPDANSLKSHRSQLITQNSLLNAQYPKSRTISEICFIVVRRVGIKGRRNWFCIIPISDSMAFTPAGFPSTKSNLNNSVNL